LEHAVPSDKRLVFKILPSDKNNNKKICWKHHTLICLNMLKAKRIEREREGGRGGPFEMTLINYHYYGVLFLIGPLTFSWKHKHMDI